MPTDGQSSGDPVTIGLKFDSTENGGQRLVTRTHNLTLIMSIPKRVSFAVCKDISTCFALTSSAQVLCSTENIVASATKVASQPENLTVDLVGLDGFTDIPGDTGKTGHVPPKPPRTSFMCFADAKEKQIQQESNHIRVSFYRYSFWNFLLLVVVKGV